MEPADETPSPTTDSIRFTASDGAGLIGDLVRPSTPRAAAVVCHPHPQYGGDRHNNVVQALFRSLPSIGVAALRFDFRSDFDEGRGEGLDMRAAIDEMVSRMPGVPVIAAGYSFGAMIALGAGHPAVTHRLLVAPPLGLMDVEPASSVPTLVLSPQHDQFCPPERAEPIIVTWGNTEFATIGSADHFLLGATAEVGRLAAAWLDGQLGAQGR